MLHPWLTAPMMEYGGIIMTSETSAMEVYHITRSHFRMFFPIISRFLVYIPTIRICIYIYTYVYIYIYMYVCIPTISLYPMQ